RAPVTIPSRPSPFFPRRFFPESSVVKALVLYQNCRYPDARATLDAFEQRYRPLHDGISETLASLTTPQSAAEFLTGGKQFIPEGAREEVARVAHEPDVQGAARAAVELAQELDSLDKRPAAFRNSGLIARVAPLARRAGTRPLERAARKLTARLSQERAELKELLGQSLRLSYEIAGREKELALEPANDPAQVQPKDRPQVADKDRPQVADDE